MNNLEKKLKRLDEAEKVLIRAETELSAVEAGLSLEDEWGNTIAHFEEGGWLYMGSRSLNPSNAQRLTSWLTDLYAG